MDIKCSFHHLIMEGMDLVIEIQIVFVFPFLGLFLVDFFVRLKKLIVYIGRLFQVECNYMDMHVCVTIYSL